MSAAREVIDLTAEEVKVDDEVQIITAAEAANTDGFWIQWTTTTMPIRSENPYPDIKFPYCKYFKWYKNNVEYTDDIINYMHRHNGRYEWAFRNASEHINKNLARDQYLSKRNHWWAFRELTHKFSDLGIKNEQVRIQLCKMIIEYLLVLVE